MLFLESHSLLYRQSFYAVLIAVNNHAAGSQRGACTDDLVETLFNRLQQRENC